MSEAEPEHAGVHPGRGQDPLDPQVICGLVDDRARLLAGAGLQLDALQPHAARLLAHAPIEAAQLGAIAAACDRPLHELLVLDGGLVELLTGAEIERSLGLYVDGPNGPVLAGAWALAPAEAEHVTLRQVQVGEPGSRLAWVLGLPGSLGLAGISASGHAVLGNLLRPAVGGPGIMGSALLRRLLAAPRLEQARQQIAATALVDGRNWMLADGPNFFGYEHLGGERILTRVGRKTGHVHANHCFDPSLRQREAKPRSPRSFRRLELASTMYVQRRPDTAASVLEFFTEVEAAAFATPDARANTVWAVELATGTALWRRRAGDPVIHTTFRTPLRIDATTKGRS
ncbi:hypothetical protein DB30_00827 [Enhygromyxa salina]|uniref:Acyl-coenzyme A:6-aminopenicillanic acid acyl-transferase n=1 Tax=Enhygromyxa salina TaxID=215803 RepID=A0A0C1ZPM5_9BACT|nr:hypothetical protein [Enhygromyxa salina]KIG12993.1 hypothetical protein DB30_00827 [Enhygromyxa salina]